MKLDNWQTQLRKGLLDFVALNLLKHGRCHGYEMVQTLRQTQRLDIREGNIYPVLARLQMEGLVRSYSETSRDGPPRRYFRLTKLGQKTLSDMNGYWDEIIESIQSVRQGDFECIRKRKRGTSSKPSISARCKKPSRRSNVLV
ncbi:MAG: PadR family transcriptional regulator [Planctomycetota bacterium]